jgi:hypothetical protein
MLSLYCHIIIRDVCSFVRGFLHMHVCIYYGKDVWIIELSDIGAFFGEQIKFWRRLRLIWAISFRWKMKCTRRHDKSFVASYCVLWLSTLMAVPWFRRLFAGLLPPRLGFLPGQYMNFSRENIKTSTPLLCYTAYSSTFSCLTTHC